MSKAVYPPRGGVLSPEMASMVGRRSPLSAMLLLCFCEVWRACIPAGTIDSERGPSRLEMLAHHEIFDIFHIDGYGAEETRRIQAQ